MKRILITGGSKGLGNCLINQLFSYDSGEVEIYNISRTAHFDSRVHHIPYDLSRALAEQELADILPSNIIFDLVILNAAVNKTGILMDQNKRCWDNMYQLNLVNPIKITHYLISKEFLSNEGQLFFLGSLACDLGYPGGSFYTATKSGLEHFARSLRISHPHLNICVVSPGAMDTQMAKENSPRGDRGSRRSPEDVSKLILNAIDKRREELVPGLIEKLASLLGRWLPGVSRELMYQFLFKKMK